MQTSILILSLALGLPGANSCNAQQQGLPRVGQTPPATTQGEEPAPPVADTEDADEPEEMDADDADDAGAEMFEIAADDVEDSGCPEAQAKSACKAHCEGSDSMLGKVLAPEGIPYLYADNLAQDGQVLHLKEGDLNGKVKKLTLQPGSTMILETKNGKQVVVRTQGLGGTLGTTETLSIPTLSGVIANAQATKQGQDDRVRELEQRVRELEAQLRERDGQARAGQPFHLWAPQGNAEARDKAAEERAQARELRERMSAQARDYAKQAHEQAQEMRKQAEVFQKQALEQAEVWRTRTKDSQAKDLLKWKTMKAPRAAVAVPRQPDDYVEVQPAQPNPMAETAPEPPTAGAPVGVPEPPLAWWSTTPAPDVPRARGVRTPKAPRPAKTLDAEHAQDMQKMLTDMRRQMDEMREQMQALREELQRAPQRELR